MFAIAEMLAKAGAGLLGDLINTGSDKAKEFIEQKTGVKLDSEPSEKDVKKLVEFEKQNKQLILDKMEAIFKDKQNAREMNIEIANSNGGWLLKNTGSMIALITILSVFTLFGMLLSGNLSIENPNVSLICGYAGGYVMAILSFYFGSSKTEADSKGITNGK